MGSKYSRGGDTRSDDRYKPVPKKELNKREILDNLAKPSNLGIIANAIEGVCSRTTYCKYIKDDPEFAEEVELIKLAMEDHTDDMMENKIKRGALGLEKIDKTQGILAIFYAKTKMKDRGYREGKDDIKEEADNKVEINLVVPQPKQIENIQDIEHEDVKESNNEQQSNSNEEA